MHLIVGCGYVGECVADALHDAGCEVAAITHSQESARRLAAAKPYKVLAGDISDAASVEALAGLLREGPEAVLHCASSSRGGVGMYQKVYVEGCRNLLAAWPRARFVFTSSTSVYPQTDGAVVTEESDASPDRDTSRLLRRAEDLILSAGGCVARLAGIYGPARSFVLKSFLESTAKVEGNDGDGRFLNQIHREDASTALAHLLASRHRGIYNVVDDTPMTQGKCFAHLAAKFGRPLPPSAPPDSNRKRAWTHKRISNAKLRRSGWTPRFPSYFDALEHDVELVPSVLAQVRIQMDAAPRIEP